MAVETLLAPPLMWLSSMANGFHGLDLYWKFHAKPLVAL